MTNFTSPPLNKRQTAFLLAGLSCLILLFGLTPEALAHGVADLDKGYIQATSGVRPIPFIYLGAKHMVTGYDHLLFLFGVIFFLYHVREVSIYVTLFAVGHIITLLSGVLFEINVNAHIIDAIIGFSIVYKALDNLGAFERWIGFQPNTMAATFLFGLFHGFGLATKILDYELSEDGLIANLIFFNIGVELGQILALVGILIMITYWRKSGSFLPHAVRANMVLMLLGFLLMGYQFTGYFAA